MSNFFFFNDILRSYDLINCDIYVIVKDLDYSYVVVEMWNVTFFFLNDILRKWEEKEDRKFEEEAF